MLINSSQEVKADSGQAASSISVPVLPQSMTYWDPHLGSVVHRTCEGLIKAKTSLGPQGFLVGTFEGFEAQPFCDRGSQPGLTKIQGQQDTG